MPVDDVLLQVHAAATAALAGLVWVVQLVVYPAFLVAGPSKAWPSYHRQHTTAMAVVVAVPWAVQGLAVTTLLVRQPGPLVLLAATLAAVTVGVTVLVSVPLHTRLGAAYDESAARRLIWTNWARTAAWTAGAVVAAVLAARGAS